MSALAYLRRHWKIVLLFAAFTGIFALVFSLYDLPVEAVAYAAALCMAVGAVMFLLGFLRWRARLRALEAMRSTVTVSLDGLPAPGGRAEADYQELLRILRAELARTEAAAARERREAEDYYTLWAHQIKTPIAALRLLLQSGGADSGALTAEVLRIEGYVEMALGYVRLEGGSDFVLRSCDLDEVVRGCLRKYAPLFILKKLPLDFRETGLTVLSDEKWLAFVIEQLLANALKYTRAGHVAVYAEGRALIVEDTGIGIAPEDLPRVFERGFTGYNGREDKKSTGLGLYLCSRVCHKLGHRLTLGSEPARGTRARLFFPTGPYPEAPGGGEGQ